MPNRRLALLALAALAGTACTTAPARAEGRLVDVQIVDRESGSPLDVYRARGAGWVAGTPGSRYAIRLANRSGARVLVVLSVDGINAVSGETASTGQTGYVLGPWQTADITGWRKSDRDAAAFYFTALPDSYAARTDRPGNVGVIGAAVFRERVVAPPPVSFPSPRRIEPSRDDAGPAERPAAAAPRAEMAQADAARESRASGMAAERERKLGTGHGEREYSPVSSTSFERASSQPSELVQLRYDSWVNLRAAGIVPPLYRPDHRGAPQPFPGYVPDPRG